MTTTATTQADDLYELISERVGAGRSMIFTSNRKPADWYPLFANPVVAESLLDRLGCCPKAAWKSNVETFDFEPIEVLHSPLTTHIHYRKRDDVS